MKDTQLQTDLIEKLIAISKEAGNAILGFYNSEIDVQFKSDTSPLTKADLASHNIIIKRLKNLTPNTPILSEEGADISFLVRSKWNEYWLIDPLDGTKEFINKNDEFTTNIAYIRDNRPVFGMIYAPALNEIYWGSEENGSYILRGDNLKNIEKITALNRERANLTIACSRSHPSKKLNHLVKNIKGSKIVNIGSSLKFCLVAKGEVDCYPRFGPTSEWDTAAGEIIARSSGASVVDLENNTLVYNKKNGFLNPDFIVASNNKLTKKLLSTIEYL